jgi:hypothetical protein
VQVSSNAGKIDRSQEDVSGMFTQPDKVSMLNEQAVPLASFTLPILEDDPSLKAA